MLNLSVLPRRLFGGTLLVPAALPKTSDLFMTPMQAPIIRCLVTSVVRVWCRLRLSQNPRPGTMRVTSPRRTGLFLGFTRLSEGPLVSSP